MHPCSSDQVVDVLSDALMKKGVKRRPALLVAPFGAQRCPDEQGSETLGELYVHRVLCAQRCPDEEGSETALAARSRPRDVLSDALMKKGVKRRAGRSFVHSLGAQRCPDEEGSETEPCCGAGRRIRAQRCPDEEGSETATASYLQTVLVLSDALMKKGVKHHTPVDNAVTMGAQRCPDEEGSETDHQLFVPMNVRAQRCPDEEGSETMLLGQACLHRSAQRCPDEEGSETAWPGLPRAG